MNKLYHYVHCPFCVRVRMALGFLQMPYESIVLANDDEKTPISLTGVKMLPIFQAGDFISNESLLIISWLDKKNLLRTQELVQNNSTSLASFLDEISGPLHSLVMPYWVYTAEFTQSAREYFLNKKEAKRGPFGPLMKQRKKFEEELWPHLEKIETKIRPFYESTQLTVHDIVLASHLWGLFMLPEFRFSEKIHSYLMEVKSQCRFEYHADFYTLGFQRISASPS